jgi:hypothetical protein
MSLNGLLNIRLFRLMNNFPFYLGNFLEKWTKSALVQSDIKVRVSTGITDTEYQCRLISPDILPYILLNTTSTYGRKHSSFISNFRDT